MNQERIPAAEGAGVVLAGGRSRRLGSDKRVERVGGRTLLRRAVDVLGEVFESVMVVADAGSVLDVPAEVAVVRDRYPDCGPLAGIHAALSSCGSGRVFVAGCDMPFLNVSLIRHLFVRDPRRDAVVPRAGGRTQCLHAVYSCGCATVSERLLLSGTRAVEHLVEALDVCYVDEEDLRLLDPELSSFFNVNTPADLAEAEKRAASLSN